MRIKLNQEFVRTAKAGDGAERTLYWDQTMPGFGLMVTDAGAKSFVVQYRAGGVSRRMKIGDNLTVDEARKLARKRLSEVDHGRDPLKEKRKEKESAKNSLRSIVEEYQRREGGRLRTAGWRIGALERHVLKTALADKNIEEIKRSDIVRLLDTVEDRGPVMADKVLAILSRIFNWHAARSDDFRSPIIRGMARTSTGERSRDRILSDDELRAVWRATESPTGPFPALVRFLLLTAARRSEAAEMRWDELVGKDWVLPGARNKTGLELVRPLTDAAMDVLAGLPKIGKGEFVFATVRSPHPNFDRGKKQFDAACGVTGWTLHDLRRSARSLMSRAGVPSDHAERCLGHVIGGVRGTYDRHEYHEEKRRAFEALAAQIERIVNPQENVVPIRITSS